MTILVTGATGFIGRALAKCMAERSLPARFAVRDPAVGMLPRSGQIEMVGEIDGHTEWRHTLSGVSTVIHLAGVAHRRQLGDTARQEDEFRRVNTEGTTNLLQQAIAERVQHFVYVSSVGAVTSSSESRVTEQSRCHPDTLYGKSKLDAERSVRELSASADITWTILRPTLVYGPNAPGNMARLNRLLKTRIPLPLRAVRNRRSLLYVGNLVDAMIACTMHPGAHNQTFLVSDGEDVSTPELLYKLGQHSGYSCRLWPLPTTLLRLAGRIGDVAQLMTRRPLPIATAAVDRLLGSLVVDSSKIRDTLDWTPPYTLDDGLAATFAKRSKSKEGPRE